MTLFAFVAQPKVARLAIDTRMMDAAAEGYCGGNQSKAHPIPHLRAVVFGRGAGAVINTVAFLLNAAGLDDIADAPDHLPDLLEQATGEVMDALDFATDTGRLGVDRMALTEEQTANAGLVMVAGYSPRAGRVVTYYATADGGAWTVAERPPGPQPVFAPCDGLEGMGEGDGSKAHLRRIVQAQYRAVQDRTIPDAELFGDHGCGGLLTTFEVTPRGVEMGVEDAFSDAASARPLSRQERRKREREQAKMGV